MECQFPRRDLVDGSLLPFSLVRFTSLSRFFVAIEDDEGRRDRRDLEVLLRKYRKSSEAKLSIEIDETTTAVVVELEPGQYFRAEIRHPAGQNVYVDLVDVGVVRRVHKCKIFAVSSELKHIPVISYECCLMGVYEKLDKDCEFLLVGQRVELTALNVEPSGAHYVSCSSNGSDLGLLAVYEYGVTVFAEPSVKVDNGIRKYSQIDLQSMLGIKKPTYSYRLAQDFQLLIQVSDTKPVRDAISRSRITPVDDIVPGFCCLGKTSEMEDFLRVEVLCVFFPENNKARRPDHKCPETYLVLFVDFGETAVVGREGLANLPDELMDFPSCAQTVSIIDSFPSKEEEVIKPHLEQTLILMTVVGEVCGKTLVDVRVSSGPQDYKGTALTDLL